MLHDSHITSPRSNTSLALGYSGHPLPRNVAWVEGEAFTLSFDISDARQPVRSCVGIGKGAHTCFPRVRLTVHILQMLCMCPLHPQHLGCTRLPLQPLQRTEPRMRSMFLSTWLVFLSFSSLFLDCLLLEGWEVVPTLGPQLLGSLSLLDRAPALLHPPPHALLLWQAAPAS